MSRYGRVKDGGRARRRAAYLIMCMSLASLDWVWLFAEAGSDEDEKASDEESEESEESERSRCSSPANAQLGLKVGSKVLHATHCYTATVLEL